MSVMAKASPVSRPNLLILAVALGVILNPLNTTMITVALPEIRKEFGLTSSDISWLIASYFMVSAVFLPLIGKLSDHYGRKKIFLLGLILVAISSITAPLSPNMLFLLGMRTIQAIGTSALYPAGIGIVRNHINKNQNRVIGTLSIFATTSAAFGPTISGLLIQYGGWPIIFYVNFPVIILSAILAIVFIPSDGKIGKGDFKWDGIGIILFSSLIFLWMYFFLQLEYGFSLWTFIGSAAITVLFFLYENRKAEPFIDVNFLRKNLNISFVYIQYIMTTVIFFALLLSMPTYLQSVIMLDTKTTGLMMLSLSIFGMIVTPIATRWMEAAGFRFPILSGVTVGVIGVLILLIIGQNSPLYWIVIGLAVIGTSNGTINIGLQNLLYSFVSKAESGLAAGLLMTSRFIGNILASSLFGVTFAKGITDHSQNTMIIVLLVVSIVLFPGMIFITKIKR